MTRRRVLYVAARLRRMQTRLGALLAHTLRLFFADQARRVVARHRLGAPDLLPPEETARLALVLEPRVRAMVLEAAGLSAALAGAPTLEETDIRLLAILVESATRIRRVSEETRRAVRITLLTGTARGYSPWQIANGVPKDGFRGLRAVVTETYRGRAETIARTEMALACQAAAHDRYQVAGVTEVDVTDGPGCGWRHHDDPDKAHGTRRPLGEVLAYPVAHPNCRRVSIPVLGSRR